MSGVTVTSGRPNAVCCGVRLLAAVSVVLSMGVVSGCRKRTDISGYPEIVERIPETELQAERVKTIEVDRGELRGIAIDADDRVYVLGSAGVRVLNGEGAEVATWRVPADARAIAVADDGTVYVALTTRILTFGRDGKALGAWGVEGTGPGELGHVTSISVSGAHVLVADWKKLCIQRFTSTGRFVNLIGKRDDAKKLVGLLAPSAHLDFDVDTAGNVVVGNCGRLRVETYAMDGTLVSAWGKPGFAAERFAPCCNPSNLALMHDGNVVTAEKGLPRVKVYDRTGKLLAYIPREGNFSKEVKDMDLAVDSKNRIHVVEPIKGVVMVFRLTKAAAPPEVPQP